MAVNLPTLTVCLLASAILQAHCSLAMIKIETTVAASPLPDNTTQVTSSSATQNSTTISQNSTTIPQNSTTITQNSTTIPQNSTTITKNSTTPDQASSTLTQASSTTPQSNTTTDQVFEDTALSAGEIAGITVGSIAGVAAIGGGIFAGLKFSGVLGG
ncbi:hypothetical protein DPEC_G00222980 [Dallia pectoralis]|uniref:Uncharacterized protein n=1 Tax=Dallia pectoralis TaxID=75939 RepID=A0ACC2FZV5_DALPE|nr:hypothetical protein DPEC_G00222980 [Dallia pectoralis]